MTKVTREHFISRFPTFIWNITSENLPCTWNYEQEFRIKKSKLTCKNFTMLCWTKASHCAAEISLLFYYLPQHGVSKQLLVIVNKMELHEICW